MCRFQGSPVLLRPLHGTTKLGFMKIRNILLLFYCFGNRGEGGGSKIGSKQPAVQLLFFRHTIIVFSAAYNNIIFRRGTKMEGSQGIKGPMMCFYNSATQYMFPQTEFALWGSGGIKG